MKATCRPPAFRICAKLVSVAIALAIVGVTLDQDAHAGDVDLGTANNFAVLAGSTITNTGPTTVSGGNIGVSPGSAITGFPPGTIAPPSTTHLADAVALGAQKDLATAYNTAAGLARNAVLTGEDLGGLTLTPGVYFFASSAQLTGTLTLDDQGNPDAVFVFQIGSTLTTASASVVESINDPSQPGISVFWQVGSSATLGTGTDFEGNILADTSITVNTGAIVDGRLLAENGAVTLDSNAIAAPPAEVIGGGGSPVPDTGGTLLLLGAGVAALLACSRRALFFQP